MNLQIKGFEKRMNVDTKRMIIEQVLCTYIEPVALSKVMHNWHLNYSRESVYVLQKFIGETIEANNVNAKVSDIIKEIVVALNQHKKAENETQPSTEIAALEKTFYQFIAALHDKIDENMQRDVQNSFFELSDTLNATQTDALNFLFLGEGYIKANFDDDTMRQLVANFYQSMCTWIGPIDADLMLAKSIKEIRLISSKEMISKLI